MDANSKTSEINTKTNESLPPLSLRKVWPSFFISNAYVVTIAALDINLIIISQILWPGDAFHASEIGILLGIPVWTIAFSGLIFGYLADHFSRVKLLSIIVVMFGLGVFLSGFTPESGGTSSFNYLLVCFIFAGFFNGGYGPVLRSYDSDVADPNQLSRYYGILQASIQIFQVVGTIITALLFEENLWRHFFWAMGILNIGFGIAIHLKLREPKRGKSRLELKDELTLETAQYSYTLTKATFRQTVITPTNLIAFFEGFFTSILVAIPDFLLIGYLEDSPHNLSPFILSLLLALFGIPGAVIGSVGFGKLSDKMGKRNIRNRLYFITAALVALFIILISIFFLPLPVLTISEGRDVALLITPFFIGLGCLIFFSRVVGGVYSINQPPILQEINLPEVYGFITSANQLLEALGTGAGPILSGILIAFLNHNYQLTAVFVSCIGIVGALLWLLASNWVKRDVLRVSRILQERASNINSS